jgi:actin-like ATPase involved in cell morphogenesis
MKIVETGEAILVGGIDALDKIDEWQKVRTVSLTIGKNELSCAHLEQGETGEHFRPYETMGLVTFNGCSIPLIVVKSVVITDG